MMDDTDYQDKLCLNDIKDAVAAVDKAAVCFAIFGCGGSDERILAKPGESPVETAHVGLAYFLAKDGDAVSVYFLKVGDSCIGKLNVSHASRAVGR